MTNEERFLKMFIKEINNTNFKNPCRWMKAKQDDIDKYKKKIIELAKNAIKWNYWRFDEFWNQRYFEWWYLSSSLSWQLDFIFNSPDWFTYKNKHLNSYYKQIRQLALWKDIKDNNILDALIYLKQKI